MHAKDSQEVYPSVHNTNHWIWNVKQRLKKQRKQKVFTFVFSKKSKTSPSLLSAKTTLVQNVISLGLTLISAL